MLSHAFVTLSPLERPVVRVESHSKHFQGGEDVRLKCRAQGYPLPSLAWTKDGVKVKETDKLVIDTDHTLLIKNAEKSDAGSYECVAQSDVGRSRATVTLSYTGNDSPVCHANAPVDICVYSLLYEVL